jgi:hypothetical protein
VRKQEIVMQSEALGSPFDPVTIGTQTWVQRQGNNAAATALAAQVTHPQYP